MKAIKKLACLLLAMAVSIPASGREEGRHYDEGRWHGDIRHFHEHDFPRWRAGRWHHGFHDGRVGWWWVVGPIWYFYPRPIYPYPNPYVPPAVVIEQPVQYWYYCVSAAQYYPYAPVCPEGWRMVPAR